MGAHCARACIVDEPHHVVKTTPTPTAAAAEAVPSTASTTQHHDGITAASRSGDTSNATMPISANRHRRGGHHQNHHHRQLGPPRPLPPLPPQAPRDSTTSISFGDATAVCSGPHDRQHQLPLPQEAASRVLNPLTVRFYTDDDDGTTDADGAAAVASSEERRQLVDIDLQLWTCGRGAGAGTLRKAATALMPIITGTSATTNTTCSTTGDQRLLLSSSQGSAPMMHRNSCLSNELHVMAEGAPIAFYDCDCDDDDDRDALPNETGRFQDDVDDAHHDGRPLALDLAAHPQQQHHHRSQRQHRGSGRRSSSTVCSGSGRRQRSVASTTTTSGARDPLLEVSIAATSWASSSYDDAYLGGLHRLHPPSRHHERDAQAATPPFHHGNDCDSSGGEVEEDVEFDIDAMPVMMVQLAAAPTAEGTS